MDIVERLRARFMDTKNMLPCALEHEAADEIERLRSELEGTTRAYQMERKACFDLTEKVIPNLRESAAALELDAARYRWLRERDWFVGPLCIVRDPQIVLQQPYMLGRDCPSRERLDAAIDAAMKL